MHRNSYRSFLIAVFIFLFFIQVAVVAGGAGPGMRGRADFRHLYSAGYMVRSGHGSELYDYDANLKFQNLLVNSQDVTLRFNHLAFEALFYVPLSLLNFRVAYAVFMLINVALLLAAAWIARPYLRHLRDEWRWLPLAAFVCFLPVSITLIQGQDSIILLFLVVAAANALYRGYILRDPTRNKEFLAGVLLALTLFKFQFAIVIMVLFVAWRKWRTVAGFAAGSAAVAALSLTVTGLAAPVTYVRGLLAMSTQLATAHQQYIYGIKPELMPNIRGLVYGALHAIAPNSWQQGITVALSIAILSWAILRGRPGLDVAILVAVICSYHCMIHDAILLLLPITVTGAIGAKWVWRIVYVAPTILFLVRAPYWPMAIVLVVALLWRDSGARAGAADATDGTGGILAGAKIAAV